MTRRRGDRPERGWWHRLYVRLWTDRKFLRLTDAERVFMLYALTGPQMTRIGLCKFSLATAAEDLTLDVDDARTRLQTVCETFQWTYDQAARVLWIPHWWHWNPPTLPNNFKGWLSDLQDVPDSPLVLDFIANEADLPEHAIDVFRERTAGRKATASRTASIAALPTALPTTLKTASGTVLDTAPRTRMATDPDPDPDPDREKDQSFGNVGTADLDPLDELRKAAKSGTRRGGGFAPISGIAQRVKRHGA